MTNLVETSQWEAGVYQLETNDPVEGGLNGIDNLQAKQLANRTKWLKDQLVQATEAVLGFLKVGTQAQVDAGTDDTVAVTPVKLRYGFAVSLTSNGYIALPSFLGGLIIQWGKTPAVLSGDTVTFPITFPSQCFAVMVTENQAGITVGSTLYTNTNFTLVNDYATTTAAYFLSIGH